MPQVSVPLTNLQHYNKRGTAEQVFDRQNNDFGWEHRIPAYHRHGCKLLPIHRGIAAHGRPLWNQGHRQSQEFSVQIHRRPCQVDQNGTTIQTQHLLQQTIQHNLGARID